MSYRRSKEDGERSAKFYNRFREKTVKSGCKSVYKRERFRYEDELIDIKEDLFC